MSRKVIAEYITASCGYHLYSPGSAKPDLWFNTFEQMQKFCNEMGWKLRRG